MSYGFPNYLPTPLIQLAGDGGLVSCCYLSLQSASLHHFPAHSIVLHFSLVDQSVKGLSWLVQWELVAGVTWRPADQSESRKGGGKRGKSSFLSHYNMRSLEGTVIDYCADFSDPGNGRIPFPCQNMFIELSIRYLSQVAMLETDPPFVNSTPLQNPLLWPPFFK